MNKKGRKEMSRKMEPVPAAPPSEPPGPDDLSVPPIGDLDAAFFAGPPIEDTEIEPEVTDPLAAMKMTPGAALRRAHLARYVKGAVGVASLLCLAALLKAAVAVGHTEPRGAARSVVALSVEQTAAPAVQPVAPAADPVAPAAQPVAPAAQLVAPVEQPVAMAAPVIQAPLPNVEAKAEVAAPEVPPPAPVESSNPESASQARAAAQSALEHGKVATAIAAGERSVALDPSDGQAWLILGAAYQQKGAMKEARRCYKACVDQGKHGPRGECAAMLR